MKNCAPFTKYINKIDNTQIDNAKYIDAVMSTHTLIRYSDSYSKNIWQWQYCKDIPAVNNGGAIVNLMLKVLLIHLILKEKLRGQIGDDRTKMLK